MVSEQYIRQEKVAKMREIVAVIGNENTGATIEGLEVSLKGCAKRHVEFVNLVALELPDIGQLAKLLIRL